MNVLMVQDRFAEGVVGLVKRCSIRRERRDGKPRARVGEALSIRVWSGKPCRSKQREILRARVTEVRPIKIEEFTVSLDSPALVTLMNLRRLEDLARADGFASWPEMREWFRSVHGLPFQGVLIRWEPLKA